jgi:hypothetical protein
LKLEGTVLDGETELSTLGLRDHLVFNVEWLDFLISRLYVVDILYSRHIFDAVLGRSTTYQSLVHHFSDLPSLVAFDYAGQPLHGFELVGEKMINPRDPIVVTLRAYEITIEYGSEWTTSIDLGSYPTAGGIRSKRQERFTGGELLELRYKKQHVRHNRKIIGINPALAPMQLITKPQLPACT